jgi:hypothetical protein
LRRLFGIHERISVIRGKRASRTGESRSSDGNLKFLILVLKLV